ncbi:MAG: hypothetical protein ACRD1T_05265, partial [Acidimicrobiia bacterium]
THGVTKGQYFRPWSYASWDSHSYRSMSLNSVRTEFGSTNRGYLNLTYLRQWSYSKALDKFSTKVSELDRACP